MNDSSPTSEFPPFAIAVEQMRDFLGHRGTLHTPIWVFREDLASVKWRIWVRTPIPAKNEQRVEAHYELGRKRGFGVVIETLCLLDFAPCCFVWSPVDEEEASYSMASGLRLKILQPLLSADAVGFRAMWWYRKWRESRCQFPKYVARVPYRDGPT